MSKVLSRKGNITLEKVSSTEYHIVEPDIHGNKKVQVVSNFCKAVKTFLKTL